METKRVTINVNIDHDGNAWLPDDIKKWGDEFSKYVFEEEGHFIIEVGEGLTDGVLYITIGTDYKSNTGLDRMCVPKGEATALGLTLRKKAATELRDALTFMIDNWKGH